MRAVLTKVKHASVTIDGEVKGKIGKGFLILLGVAPDDTEEKCRKMADKLCSLRIFDDENDKINLSLDDVGGELLIISQFTSPNRYAFRAGRNLPDKEFRYLRTVIVTAAVYWGFGSLLRLR